MFCSFRQNGWLGMGNMGRNGERESQGDSGAETITNSVKSCLFSFQDTLDQSSSLLGKCVWSWESHQVQCGQKWHSILPHKCHPYALLPAFPPPFQLVRMKMTPRLTFKETYKLKMTAVCISEVYQSVQETNISTVLWLKVGSGCSPLKSQWKGKVGGKESLLYFECWQPVGRVGTCSKADTSHWQATGKSFYRLRKGAISRNCTKTSWNWALVVWPVSSSFFFFFWRHWVFIAEHGHSLISVSWGLLSSCGTRGSHFSGFSCCREQAVGAWASVVVAHGLSFSETCGILPD